ncbi:hypothetical protein SK128_027692 [Halocaridina rubra]|uniref:Uncharacterized protein n=1 Tax=Halocaridina rubra TaxID=373956 RepID=A0AAN8ZV89_HALRR
MAANAGNIVLQILQTLWLLVYTFYCIVESIIRVFIPAEYLRKDVKGQIVLVTGGGSGIGRLMCKKFAARGAKIVTWDVNTAGNDETVRQVVDLGGFCRGYTVDLCDREAIYAAAAKVKQEVGKVDILVNNAGIVTGKKFMNSPDKDILRTFDVNIFAHFWTVKAFLGDMLLANKGHIVNIASMAGWIGCNQLVDYCSSKYAAVGFDESLRLELQVEGATGIHTTVVCPIYISTGMFEGVQSKIFPLLTPDYVSEEIVEATLLNVRVLMLPKYIMRLGVILKLILPEKALYKMSIAAGMTKMMDKFVGRRKEQ